MAAPLVRIISLATVLLLTGAVGAQVLTLDDFTWTLEAPSGGTGQVTSELLHVEGPSGGSCVDAVTWLQTTAPHDGVVRARLTWDILDICHYDYPVYVVNGVPTSVLPFGSTGNCWLPGQTLLEFELVAGDTFGFGVGSVDCFEGPGLADFSDFSFLPPAWTEVGPGLDPRIARIIEPGQTAFGVSLANVGDLTGDGVDDLAVGRGGSPGTVGVNARSGADGSDLWTATGGFNFGLGLQGPGDLDGDDVPDVLASQYSASQVHALSGVDGSPLWTWTWGGSALDYYGASMAPFADVDDDGVVDLAVGTAKTGSFDVLVLSGADGSELTTITPGPADTAFGFGLTDLGDLDGDGTHDLGCFAKGPVNRVAFFSGATLGELLTFPIPGVTPFQLGGIGLLPVADRDGDGRPDVLIAAPAGATTADAGGHLTIVGGLTGTTLATFEGEYPGIKFGSAVQELDDLDGDGVRELAVSAANWPPLSFDEAGRVDVIRGTDGTVFQRFEGQTGERLGAALATVEGLSSPRLVVGAPGTGDDDGRVLFLEDLLHPGGAPRLLASGRLAGGEPFVFRVTRGLGGGLSYWVLGLAPGFVPFKGGVMGPAVDLVFALPLDGGGRVELAGTWPAGPMPPSAWLQAWMPDPAGPVGFTATPTWTRSDP